MTKKLSTLNIVQLGLWIANTIALLVVILIDKDAELLNKLFVWFWILLLGTPLVFSVAKLIILERIRPVSVDKHEWVPFLGLCVNAGLSFVFFIRSVNETGIALTVIVMLGLFAAVGLFLKRLNRQKYVFMTHAAYLGLSLVLYAAFIVALVMISFYFSVKW